MVKTDDYYDMKKVEKPTIDLKVVLVTRYEQLYCLNIGSLSEDYIQGQLNTLMWVLEIIDKYEVKV